jgi:hypothetical protein
MEYLLPDAVETRLLTLRIDDVTRKCSVIDAICIVTGFGSRDAGKTFSKSRARFPELVKSCIKLKINGKGHETWVADALTTLSIIFFKLTDVPPSVYTYQSSNHVCRILSELLLAGQKSNNSPTVVSKCNKNDSGTP